jgi:hypothetical protein
VKPERATSPVALRAKRTTTGQSDRNRSAHRAVGQSSGPGHAWKRERRAEKL